MTELIHEIDESIHECIPDATMVGLCHILLSDNDQFPSIIGVQGSKVVPNDKNTITIYHRLINGNYEPREDLQFGRKITRQNQQRIRTVVFIKIDQDQNIIDDIANALPATIRDQSEYSIISVSENVTLIRDRDAIWTEEYSAAYKDKYQVKYHVYALEYDLFYVKCNICVT